jgi:polysaccharide deacetylase family sporulation protein PdaB
MKNKVPKNLILIISILLGFSFIIYEYSKADTTSNNYGMIIKNGSKEKKVIALTFDDGPHPKYTSEILDILDEYDVKATFFVLGKFAEAYPDIIRRQWEEGHEIGNHTYSHINIKKASKDNLQKEYKKTQEIVYSVTNSKPKLFRPPYGSFDEKTIDIVEKNNSVIVLWSYKQDSKDWSNPEVNKIVNTTLSNIENGDIILFHDYIYYNESHTVEALKKIIPELKNRGYEFVTISELINLSTN